MKNILMAVILILALATGICCAGGKNELTNYYCYVESFDADTGKKSEDEKGNFKYITFTNNSCFFSDAKGTNERNFSYSYKGEQNNLYIYSSTKSDSLGVLETLLIFSKDYKRLDLISNHSYFTDWANQIALFVQADPSTKSPLISTANLAPLEQSSTAQNRPSTPSQNNTYTPPPATTYTPTPSSPSSSSSGGSGINPSFYLEQYQRRANTIEMAFSRYRNATTQRDKDNILSDIRRQQQDLRQFRLDSNSKGANINADYYETATP